MKKISCLALELTRKHFVCLLKIGVHLSLTQTVFRLNRVFQPNGYLYGQKKTTMYKAIAFVILATISCNTFVSAQTGTTTSTAAVPAGMERISLEAIGIKATMIVPEGVKAFEEMYSSYISGNNNFVISVESANDLTLEKLKAEIAADPAKKLVSTKAHSVVYMEKTMGMELAHFESYIEIDGKLYKFYDKRVTPLMIEQVTPMCEAVETIQPLQQ